MNCILFADIDANFYLLLALFGLPLFAAAAMPLLAPVSPVINNIWPEFIPTIVLRRICLTFSTCTAAHLHQARNQIQSCHCPLGKRRLALILSMLLLG